MNHLKIRPKTLLLLTLAVVGVLTSCNERLKQWFEPKDVVSVSPLAERLGFSKDRPLIMGMNTNYEPLQYVDNSGVPCGFDTEFTKELMIRLGIPFTFSPHHWDKMAPGILSGKYDLGMMVYSSYRKDQTNYSNAVFMMYYQIVYRKKDYEEFDFRHLKGKDIAYMKSRPVGVMLREGGAKDHPVTDLDSAIIQLVKGKYDGIICYRFQADYYIGQHNLGRQLKADNLSLEPREYCYASHNKELIAVINEELKKMEEDGSIAAIYGGEVMSEFYQFQIPAWVWGVLGALIFVFMVVFSIHRYLLSKRLMVATAKAEESTLMKSNFIKQISHEIRTPLNILSGFTQVLTSPKSNLTDQDKAEIAVQVEDSTRRITGLVNKMLELADVNSQMVIDRTDEVTPLEIAERAVKDSKINEAKHLVFILQKEHGALATVRTHKRSVVRIVELLLDNAMKFTQRAETYHSMLDKNKQEMVKLTVGIVHGHVTFVVEDTGIGVPVKEAEHIFDEFVQLDDYYDGTGIGLTVARSLARRLGGDIKLDTTYKDGARFVVEL